MTVAFQNASFLNGTTSATTNLIKGGVSASSIYNSDYLQKNLMKLHLQVVILQLIQILQISPLTLKTAKKTRLWQLTKVYYQKCLLKKDILN